MRTRLVLLATILWSVTAGAADDFRAIAASNAAQWNQAFAAGKVDEIVSLYAQDAILVQPDGKISRQRNEIRNFWQTLIDQGAFQIDVIDVKSEKDDTIVTTTTLSDIKTLQDSRHPLRYHYDGVLYSVLKRQSDGTWKATVQHWSEKARS
ncbi:MAG TPA: SgcJ/EcaC family oxidoreductase [Methylococcus sp.]|nr:SgcJ/EcaC family oxidoreductase [Methylococcus sp.]